MHIAKYIASHLISIRHPFGSEVAHPFGDVAALERLTKLFTAFLSHRSNDSIRSQLETGIARHLELPLGATAERMEVLRTFAASVEPFLKSIGRVRHAGDTARLETLGRVLLKNLLESGLTLPRITWDPTRSAQNHDQAYWSQQDLLTSIAYCVWRLRNQLSHESTIVSGDEMGVGIRHIVALLLFALQEPSNRLAVELFATPHRAYLEWASTELDPDQARYVPLRITMRPADGVVMPPSANVAHALPTDVLHLDVVLRAANRLVCLGGAGSGKSRSLRSVGALLARTALSSGSLVPVPILIAAYRLATSSIEDVVTHTLKNVSHTDIAEGLSSGAYAVLIDAINELASSDVAHVLNEIRTFHETRPACILVVTARQETYNSELPFPVCELQPLSVAEIREILRLYSSSRETGDRLFSRLTTDPRLTALFRTPLMSRLLCTLPGHISIPRNIGEMMALIVNRLFDVERTKGELPPQILVNLVLVALASFLRGQSGNVASELALLEVTQAVFEKYDPSGSGLRLNQHLVQMGILERKEADEIGFFHETALDYFVALGLRPSWEASSETPIEDRIIPSAAVTEILAGILQSADAFLSRLVDVDLHLAARAYGSRVQRSPVIKQRILQRAIDKLRDLEKQRGHTPSLEILARLDEPEATKIFFDSLPWLGASEIEQAEEMLLRSSPADSAEQALAVLRRGTYEQQRVALSYVGNFRLAAAAPLVIPIISAGNADLAMLAADALGRLGTAEVVNYVREQSLQPLSSRAPYLHIAVGALGNRASRELLLPLLSDPDVHVRRAAAARVVELGDRDFRDALINRLELDTDFVVRLQAARLALEQALVDQVVVIRHVFQSIYAQSSPVPANPIIQLLSTLSPEASREALLQALCFGHRGVQSLVCSHILRRSIPLALDVLGLIDLNDNNIAAGPKMALVDAAIRHGTNPEDVVRRVFNSGVPASVRQIAIRALGDCSPNALSRVAATVLHDESALVRAEAARQLARAPQLRSSELLSVISDPDPLVRRAAIKGAPFHTLPDADLVSMLQNSLLPDVRQAIASHLIKRRYLFPLELAHCLACDPTPGIRHCGFMVLRAMARDAGTRWGLVRDLNVARGFGFIYEIALRQKLFFHFSSVIGGTNLRPSDLVAVQYDESAHHAQAQKVPAKRVELLSRTP